MDSRIASFLEKIRASAVLQGILRWLMAFKIDHTKSILRGLLRWIPSFQSSGLYIKILLTIFLAGICFDLFYAKVDQAIPIIKGILSFSPRDYAEELINNDRPKSALNYIEFYESIPGTDATMLADLKKRAVDMRAPTTMAGIKYHGSQALKGFKGEKGDEIYTTIIDQGVDLFSIGDFREIYREVNNYRNGGEVDVVNASLAATGLAMTLGEIASGGAMASVLEPVKKCISTFGKSLKSMNAGMRKALGKILEPLAKTIRKSDAIEGLVKLNSISAVKEYAVRHAANFTQLAEDCSQVFKKLGDFSSVAIKNPKAAQRIAKDADSIDQLRQFSKVALAMGDNGADILKYGGKNALEAAVALEKKGALNPATLKKAMGLGENGLKALKRGMNIEKLAKKVERLKNSFVLMKLFFVQWLLSRIPWIVALLAEILLVLIIFKTWFWRSITANDAIRA